MNLQVDVERVLLAHKSVRAELLAERTQRGHWLGHVASSPLATAAAVSALVVSHHADTEDVLRENPAGGGSANEQIVQGDLCEFLLESVHWLARQQNPDGGWGDCDAAPSSIAATLMVQAAFRLTGIPAKYADLMDQADEYVAKQGGVSALRRDYGEDRSFVGAVLANCALAGIVPWRQVPTLPFELCCLPERWRQHVQMPVARPAIPAFLATGLAKFHHDPPRNPIMRLVRRGVRARALAQLERRQAADDSFSASVLTTAFIVMNLGSIGGQEHRIVQRGVEFLLSSVRGDASWPVVSNLSTTVTTLALNSLATHQQSAAAARFTEWPETATATDTVTDEMVGQQRSNVHPAVAEAHPDDAAIFAAMSVDWLLDAQRKDQNALTGLPAGGWAASDALGALPNASDTSRVLTTLAGSLQVEPQHEREQIERAASRGIEWLLRLQNEDGGWATFYHDKLNDELDASGADVTAYALRALNAWNQTRRIPKLTPAMERGWKYLTENQSPDGSFVAKWFGNEYQPENQNPVIGTGEVLITCAALDRLETETAQDAARWLLSAQHSTGGWGPPRSPVNYSGAEKDGFRARRENEALAKFCTVEETALAVAALLPLTESSPAYSRAASQGLTWLASAVEQDAHRRPAVLGFYPSKIWYHERLYPLVFSAEALSLAASRLASQRPAATPVG